MNGFQPLAAVGLVLLAFVFGPALMPTTHLDSTGVVHDGQDGSVQGAMDEVLAAAKKDPSIGFKVIRSAAMVCANGVDSWGETARIASAKAVADVFSKSVTYVADPAHRDNTMADVQRHLQDTMVAKVKAMSKKNSQDPMTMAIGLQNIQFKSTTRCVFAVARDELRKGKAG